VADRLISIFPTAILQRHLDGMEEVNRQLAALVAQIAASEPNSTGGTTTEGGFQTKDDLFQRDNPGIAALKPHIFSAVQEYAGLIIRQELTRPPKSWILFLGLGGLLPGPDTPKACMSIPAPMSAAFIMSPRRLPRLRRARRGKSPSTIPGRAPPWPNCRSSHPPPRRPHTGRHVSVSFLARTFRIGLSGRGTRICIAFNGKLILE
jgi:hypothetical protein